ncbi:hypothetical protein BD770DRAFT_398330 [Pilaira anomala]|nr:hypothetical protein BD770DRAFT_398330 [Pilaira anomala]
MCYYRTLIPILAFLLCNSYAMTISSPSLNSSIIAGSTALITWTEEIDVQLFDIHLQSFKNNSIISHLASNVNSSAKAQTIIYPNNMPAQDYRIVFTQRGVDLSSVGPLHLAPNLNIVRRSSPIVSKTTIHQSISTARLLSLITTSAVSAPIPSSASDYPNVIVPYADSSSDKPKIIFVGLEEQGTTLSSAQVAIISVSIAISSSVLMCLFVMTKSFIQNNRSSTIHDKSEIQHPAKSSVVVDYYHSSNKNNIPLKKKMEVMDNIHEEDSQYDNAYYYDTSASITDKASVSQKSNSLPSIRISMDSHTFGLPLQNLNSNSYYLNHPLPPPPDSYGSENQYMNRKSSPTVPPESLKQ